MKKTRAGSNQVVAWLTHGVTIALLSVVAVVWIHGCERAQVKEKLEARRLDMVGAHLTASAAGSTPAASVCDQPLFPVPEELRQWAEKTLKNQQETKPLPWWRRWFAWAGGAE